MRICGRQLVATLSYTHLKPVLFGGFYDSSVTTISYKNRLPRMKFNIFLALVICFCVDIRHGRPEPKLMTTPTPPQLHGSDCGGLHGGLQGSGPVGGPEPWQNCSISISGTSTVNINGSLGDTPTIPQCKWIVNRWGRPIRQICNSKCRCTSRG